MTSTLDTLQDFGVDRIRVSVFWEHHRAGQRPAAEAGLRRDRSGAVPGRALGALRPLIQAAQARGILVNLNFTSPVPRWASTESPRADLQQTFDPNPEEFGNFVRAVGTRYSGTYAGLPRVDYWSIWNEPNQAGWLTPQWSPDPRNAKSQIDAAPSIYRNLVANAWQALADTGHGTRHDPHRRDRAAGPGRQEGHLAVDRRAEVHPPPVLRRQQPQRPQGRAGLAAQLPRRHRDVRRAEPGAVPGHAATRITRTRCCRRRAAARGRPTGSRWPTCAR